MARALRLPLLLMLGMLTVTYCFMPDKAEAFTPNCDNGDGHYYGEQDLMGSGWIGCGNANWCRIGFMYFEWDCVDGNPEGVHSTNINWCSGDPAKPCCC
jgi:hypothetical protein